MAFYFASLNSGSNGNCYYAGNAHEAVLVDAGISCRETEQRMSNLGLSMQNVKAIFISHEHIDHIRGVVVLARKYRIPVYATEATQRYTGLRYGRDVLHPLKTHEPVMIGELNVTPFTKHHDAADPVSFVVEHGGIKVGVITDIGIACKSVTHYFRQCHACFLESNYDERMIMEGNDTARLKKRISGGKGHLSNSQALDLFLNHRPPFMSHLLLSHLSKNNNHPEIVQSLFAGYSGRTHIEIASRDIESALFEISSATEGRSPILAVPVRKESVQLKMFA